MFRRRLIALRSIFTYGTLAGLMFAGQVASLSAQTASDLQPRQFAAVAHNSQAQQYLLFGGTYGYQPFGDTWLLGASGWQMQSPAVNPAARISAAAAYDSAHAQFVLFGGRVKGATPSLCSPGAVPKEMTTAFFCQDTWVFDGKNWTKKTPVNSPPPRERHAMAFDAATNQVVLFGGISNATAAPLNDTWVWNGTNWSQVITAHQPPARSMHTMAYDPINQQIVMFGGDGGSEILNDTWLWNGKDWLAAPPQTTPPPLRTGAGMDFNATLGKVVLFSGSSWTTMKLGNPSVDSWTWNGSQWQQLTASEFQLITDFSTLTAAEASKAILANGTPTMLWVPR